MLLPWSAKEWIHASYGWTTTNKCHTLIQDGTAYPMNIHHHSLLHRAHQPQTVRGRLQIMPSPCRWDERSGGRSLGGASFCITWVFPKIEVPPKWMVKIMDNPINPWMIWGENPLFSQTSIQFHDNNNYKNSTICMQLYNASINQFSMELLRCFFHVSCCTNVFIYTYIYIHM